MVTHLHPAMRNRGSIPGRSKGFFSSPEWLDRLLGWSMLLTNVYREYLKAPHAWSCLLTSLYAQIKKQWSHTSIVCLQGIHRDSFTLRYILEHSSWAGIAQPVQQLATGWAVWGSNPGGRGIFAMLPDRPWGLPSFLHNSYRTSFPGIKRPGRGADQSHPSSAEDKERVVLYLLPPVWAFTVFSRVNFDGQEFWTAGRHAGTLSPGRRGKLFHP
jgi:hypothetical protein